MRLSNIDHKINDRLLMKNFCKLALVLLTITCSPLSYGFDKYNISEIVCDSPSAIEIEIDVEVNNPKSQYQQGLKERLCDYVYFESISREEALNRIRIEDQADNAKLMVKNYFGEDLADAYLGIKDGRFGLIVKSIQKRGLSIEDKALIKKIKKETGVPVSFIFNTPFKRTQVEDYLSEVGVELVMYFMELKYEEFSFNTRYDFETNIIEASVDESVMADEIRSVVKEKLEKNPFGIEIIFLR